MSAPQTVLITGAAGHLGQAVAATFRQAARAWFWRIDAWTR